MTAATVSRLGQVNAANAADALFLKVFSGEVLSSFERSAVTLDKHMVRTISSGKSAQFPVMGRSAAAYHTPGAEIVGTTLNHNEKVISINGLLLAQHFIANIDEAYNHYDVRSVYSKSMGEALAQQWDTHVLQTITQAAAASANVGDSGYAAGTVLDKANALTTVADLISVLFEAAATMDNSYVPSEDRYCFLKPAQYYLLANASTAANRDYGGTGNIASGMVYEVAGFKLVKTPHLPTTNVTGTSTAAGGAGGAQVADSRNTVALCMHPSAVGTVKLMDLAFETAYDIRRQGTLMVAKYAAGHGVLRPEAAVRIRTAAP